VEDFLYPLDGSVFENNVLQWQSANGERSNGRIHFFVDPAMQLPKFIGSVWSAEPRPDHANFFGVMADDSATGVRWSRSGDGDTPSSVWETLAAIGRQDCDPAYHLLWSRWQRARFTFRLLNNLVPRVCEVERVPKSRSTKGEQQS
jgi:hypothetical protein